MSRILLLGKSGGGKSSSLGSIPELGIKGLDPKETLIISATNKGLPFPGWKKHYTPVTKDASGNYVGNYYFSNNSEHIASVIGLFLNTRPEIKNFVLDDTNYVIQDHYMLNGKKANGFAIFKEISYMMAQIFDAADKIDGNNKNFIMIAHYETYEEDGTTKYKFKTVGKAIDSNITPEGKFEIVLVADQEMDPQTKTVKKYFVTNYDGKIDVAKSPFGMFKDKHIPNDMGLVLDFVEKYENI